jgi:hypothetical protein
MARCDPSGDPGVSRVWRYVLAVDNGMAPCVQDGMLSLTCCKPMIRRNASVGDWVIGFVPKGLKRSHVAWAGRVSEVIPLGEYEKRFSGRRDALYRLADDADGQQENLVPLREDYHADELSRSRDHSGKNALVFDPFWYWGGVGIVAPEEISDMAHYYVGQSAKNSSPERIVVLKAWLRSVSEPGIHGEPRGSSHTRGSPKRSRCA